MTFLKQRVVHTLLYIFILLTCFQLCVYGSITNGSIIDVRLCSGSKNYSAEISSKVVEVEIQPEFTIHTKSLFARLKLEAGRDCKFGQITVLFQNQKQNGHPSVKILLVENVQDDFSSRFGTEIAGGFRPNGNLVVGPEVFGLDEYCINTLNSKEIKISACLKKCSSIRPCVRKCCKQNEAWDISTSSCITSRIEGNISTVVEVLDAEYFWRPSFYNMTSDCVIKIPAESTAFITKDIPFIDGLPEECLSSEDRHTIPSKNVPNLGLGRYRMLMNGSVAINNQNGSWIILRLGTFCMDEMIMTSHKSGSDPLGQVLLVCKDEFKMRGRKRPIPAKYATMLFSAAIILLITAIIYILLWDRHNVYEWTVFFEVISMFFMIIFVATSHTIARNPNDGLLGSGICIFLGLASHFFFMATFFWLLVINFEIWWNFRILTLKNKKSRRWLRLINYQIVAWGGPTIMVTTGIILDRKYGLQNDEIDCSNIIIPNYGQLNCYISKKAQGPFLYYPIGVLLGFNLLFYIMTIFKMCEYQKSSQAMTNNRSNGNFQPVNIFARLFVVMGVSWISEIFAWALSPKEKGIGIVPLHWIVFDIVTLLQAIAIFIIFICRKEILSKLLVKYPFLAPLLTPFTKLSCCSLSPKQVQVSPKTVNSDLDKNRSSEDEL